MIPSYRQDFNRRFTAGKYQEFLRRIEVSAGSPVEFRCSETPVFLPASLANEMASAGRELCAQLQTQEYRRASGAIIPAEFYVPNEPEHPLFVQADFGVIRSAGGEWDAKLIEIQGFPSIYALQALLSATYRDVYGLDANLSSYFNDGGEDGFISLFERAVLNGHRPEDVVLLEIDPYHQKTLPDFLLTQKRLGIRIADIAQVEKRGRKLYHDGKPIERIYNRVVFDELVKRKYPAGFHFSDELDVEWAGHPNWFFRLSKFSLPWFQHPSVPHTRFLSDFTSWPDQLENYVLKPLFSFAGSGVRIGPTRQELDAIPEKERGNYVLQERIDFVPVIDTPAGTTKLEVRITYILQGELIPVATIIRTGRSQMMGVDFNRDLEWVGASAGFFPKD